MYIDWDSQSTQFWVEYLKAQGYCRIDYKIRTVCNVFNST